MATTTRTRNKKASRSKASTTRKAPAPRKGSARKKTATRPKTTAKAGTTTRRKATARRKPTTGRKATGRKQADPRSPIGAGSSISKTEFGRGAKQLQVRIGSGEKGATVFELDPREFSSGSFGWFASEKLDVPIGRQKVRCQLSLNVTVIGSKNSR